MPRNTEEPRTEAVELLAEALHIVNSTHRNDHGASCDICDQRARDALLNSPRLAAALSRSGDPAVLALRTALERAAAAIHAATCLVGHSTACNDARAALSGAPLVHAEEEPDGNPFGTRISVVQEPPVERTGELDAAWAAAEAALLEGWRIELLRRSPFDFWKWLAYANGQHESDIATGSGLTPAAALRGLASNLSATPTDEAPK